MKVNFDIPESMEKDITDLDAINASIKSINAQLKGLKKDRKEKEDKINKGLRDKSTEVNSIIFQLKGADYEVKTEPKWGFSYRKRSKE